MRIIIGQNWFKRDGINDNKLFDRKWTILAKI